MEQLNQDSFTGKYYPIFNLFKLQFPNLVPTKSKNTCPTTSHGYYMDAMKLYKSLF